MPSIRVWRDPATKEFSKEYADQLVRYLRSEVSETFGIPESDTEVLFLPVEKAINACSLNIEIVYSVSQDFQPSKEKGEYLAKQIPHVITYLMDGMGDVTTPEDIESVSCWVLPQQGSFYFTVEVY